jgi:membrane protein YqaA with SNARE-associated domain
VFTLFVTLLTWLERLGGLGLLLWGVADNSMVLPGGMDALTLLLSAHQRSWWPYYAAMATIGSAIGAYVTYTLGRKGGKETLMRRLSTKRAEKIYRGFSKHGFWSLFIPALLPPPMPYAPFLLAAGALQYPRQRFLATVASARAIRYFALAYLGSWYGKEILTFLQQNYEPILWTIVAVGILGGLAAAAYLHHRRRESEQAEEPASPSQGPVTNGTEFGRHV